jgi:AAHS family 4-hydroxybenzoate transporter-like MFS transporter
MSDLILTAHTPNTSWLEVDRLKVRDKDMQHVQTASTLTIDIGTLLDNSPFTFVQKWVVALAAASIIFDGVGVSIIGYAIPKIAHEWGVSGKAFAPVVTAGLVGMVLGSAYAGIVADKMGRRWAVIGSVFVFALSTAGIGMVRGIHGLAVLRFLAGAGIGGALPTSSTFVAEFTPARIRTVAVTCTIVCVPFGGMLAGLMSAAVLPAYGWRLLFVAGGAIPAVLGIALLILLPESPRFLARHSRDWPKLIRLLRRMGQIVEPKTHFIDETGLRTPSNARISALFSAEFMRDTMALWSGLLLCMFTLYSVNSWLPTVLFSAGFNAVEDSYGLAAFQGGGIAGAVVCSLVITRLGSKWPMIGCCALCSLMAIAAAEPQVTTHFKLLMAVLTAMGFFGNAVQSTMYGLCAFVYPTAIRARGVASAVASGRVGAALAGVAGALVVASTTRYFLMLSSTMALVLASLAMVRRHIPANR